MPKLLLGLLAVQFCLACHFWRRVQQWWQSPEKRPRRWGRVWVWHGVVVFLNLALAYFGLIAVPAAFGITLRLCYLYTPDVTLLVIFSATFALLWCVIRTVLMVWSYQSFGPTAVSTI